MQLKVNNCGECPFYEGLVYDCCHPLIQKRFDIDNLEVIDPSCPEGGAFKIKTSSITIQIKEDETK